MARQRKGKEDGPRWRAFMLAADRRIVSRGGYAARDAAMQQAAEIVAHGDGTAFLKATRRGRATQRQNLRYQLLREVERLMSTVKDKKLRRRRVDSNTPDALALKMAAAGFELVADYTPRT